MDPVSPVLVPEYDSGVVWLESLGEANLPLLYSIPRTGGVMQDRMWGLNPLPKNGVG